MTGPELVHPVPVEALDPWMRQLMTALLNDPYADDLERRVEGRAKRWRPERAWGVRDRDRWVATLATEQRTLSVPGGGEVALDALTAVSVSATHRRQGLLTTMITQSLRDAHDRGDTVSALVAAEWPIYGRFGYAPAVDTGKYVYRPRRRGARIEGDPTRVRQVDRAELRDLAPGVFAAARRTRAGQLDRDDHWWDRQLGTNGYPKVAGTDLNWFVHDGDDGPDGYVSWKVGRDFDLNGTFGSLEIGELVAANDQAHRNLWAYLCGIELVDELALDTRPVDEPVRWLPADGRSLHHVQTVDLLWVRLLDVPAALSARTYATDGHVVLDVVDTAVGGYASGRVALTVTDGVGVAEPTDAPADLRLDQRRLAGSYLGGHRLLARPSGTEVVELTPGAAARLDLMLSTPLAPWNQTYF